MTTTANTEDLPPRLECHAFVEITTKSGAVVTGTVVYDRFGTIKLWNAVGQRPRWAKRADIVKIRVY